MLSILSKYLYIRLSVWLVIFFVFIMGLMFLVALSKLAVSFNDYDFPISFLFPLFLTELPKTFLTVLPVCVYLTIVVTLNRFNVKGETLIMQGVGLSKTWFLKRVIIFAIPWVFIMFLMTFIFLPKSIERTEELILKAESQLNINFEKSSLKTFGEDLMLSFTKERGTEHLEELVVFISQGSYSFLVSAKKGNDYEKNGSRWLGLSGVSMVQESSKQTSLSYIKNLDIPLTPVLHNSLRAIYRNIRMQSASELLDNWKIPERGELYWRISWVAFMMLIPCLAVLRSGYRSEGGSFDSVLPALLVSLVYYKALIFIRDYTEESLWSPEVAYAMLYIGSAVFVGLLVFRKGRLRS